MFKRVVHWLALSSLVVVTFTLGGGSLLAKKVSSDSVAPRIYLPAVMKGFATVGDPTRYNFETDNQSWWPDNTTAAFRVERVSNYAYQGDYSLRVDFIDLNGGTEPPNGKPANVRVWTSEVPDYVAGTTITARVLLPPGSPSHLRGLIFVQDFDYTWIPSAPKVIVPGFWNTLTFTIPSNAERPIQFTGFQLYNPIGGGSWSGSVYVDSVHW